MDTFDVKTPYGPSRDEAKGVPQGMEAFGPVTLAEPLTLTAPGCETAAAALRRLRPLASERGD